MIKYEMVSRKPLPVYKVEHNGNFATVKKTDGPRCKRWELFLATESKFFKSRRAAFHFFETGEKYKTNPVYASRGKATTRIR